MMDAPPRERSGLEGDDLTTLLEAYVTRVEGLWAAHERELLAQLEAERRTVAALEARVKDLEHQTARLAGALEEVRRSSFFRSTLPRNLRPSLEEREADTLARARRGETPSQIAAAQRRPVGEVELVLRLATGRRPMAPDAPRAGAVVDGALAAGTAGEAGEAGEAAEAGGAGAPADSADLPGKGDPVPAGVARQSATETSGMPAPSRPQTPGRGSGKAGPAQGASGVSRRAGGGGGGGRSPGEAR